MGFTTTLFAYLTQHATPTTIALTIAIATILLTLLKLNPPLPNPFTKTTPPTTPISVNYPFTRKCNATCAFCFHTEKTSYIAPLPSILRGLRLLQNAGMRKLNFAGGEPFLYPSLLAKMARYAKLELGLESVSIITNGSKVTREWLAVNGKYVDVLGVSCDSFNDDTNVAIGRGRGDNLEQLFRIRGWCREFGIKFKLNTVVCGLNWEEDMAETVGTLEPFRWKCFQVLVLGGENDSEIGGGRVDKRKRDAKKLLISDEEYAAFCARHAHLKCFVPESNSLMASSYLILDEYLCFLDKGTGVEKQSSCILDVGAEKALEEVEWDQEAFVKRGGVYDWTKDVGCSSELSEELKF